MKYGLSLLMLACGALSYGATVNCTHTILAPGGNVVACPGLTAAPGNAIDSIQLLAEVAYSSSSPWPATNMLAVLQPGGPLSSVQPLSIPFTVPADGSPGASGVYSTHVIFTAAITQFAPFPINVNLSSQTSFPSNIFGATARLVTTESPIGSSQSNAVQPSSGSNGTWTFLGVPGGLWCDPPLTDGYDYAGLSGTTFTQITLPTGFGGNFNVFNGANLLGSFAGGSSVDFVALAGAALSSFRVSGISPLVDAASPTAFPLQVFFSTPTGSFTQTALVPEASTLGLAALPLALLFWRQRRR